MNIFNGILGERIDERDYQFTGEVSIKTLPKAKNSFRKVWYNQNDVSSNSCTLHSAMAGFSDLTGYEFTLAERKALWEEAKKLGASDNFGWYTLDAVNLVRKYANEKLNLGKFVTIRVALGFDEFYTALKQGYSVCTGYNGNQEYNNDLLDDGIIQETALNGEKQYAHAIRLVDPDITTPNEVEVRDNYRGSTTWRNEYKIPNVIELYKNGVFFMSGYIFAYDEEVAHIIDKKLTQRFENKLIFNVKTGEYAHIENGVKVIVTSLADLINKCKDTTTKTTYACGVTQENWDKIGS